MSLFSQWERLGADLSLTVTEATDKWIAYATETERNEALRSLLFDAITHARRRVTAQTEIAALDALRAYQKKQKTVTIRMNFSDVETRLAEIVIVMRDDERAHSLEDALYRDLLQALADGQLVDPEACARLALTSQEMNFNRWCA